MTGMRSLAFGLMFAFALPGGGASAVDLLGGRGIQPSPQVQRSLQAAQQQAMENRLRRQLYQAEQRLLLELDRRAIQAQQPAPVPEFLPSCRAPVRGTAQVPLRCR